MVQGEEDVEVNRGDREARTVTDQELLSIGTEDLSVTDVRRNGEETRNEKLVDKQTEAVL